MLETDEDALICDFAETYHVYDWERLPLKTAAVLASGLRESSRIKTKLSGFSVPLDLLLLASVRDYLALLWWSKTEDAQRGHNKPEMVVSKLTGNKSLGTYKSFDTAEDFEDEWKKITMN